MRDGYAYAFSIDDEKDPDSLEFTLNDDEYEEWLENHNLAIEEQRNEERMEVLCL